MNTIRRPRPPRFQLHLARELAHALADRAEEKVAGEAVSPLAGRPITNRDELHGAIDALTGILLDDAIETLKALDQ